MKTSAALVRATVLGLALTGLWSTVTCASTIGNPLIQRSFADCCSPYLFVLPGLFFPVPAERVTSWSIYSSGTGLGVTPLLFTQNSPTTFTLTGVGTTVFSPAAGVQTFAFGLVSGSDVVGANTVLGFWQQFGSIEWDPGAGSAGFLLGGVPSVGQTLPGFALDSREYSVEFTTVTPEPLSMFLGGTGLITLACAARKRLFRRSRENGHP